MRVELPDGEWAEYCSPRKVSDRRRRAWIAASADANAATIELPRDPKDPDSPDGRYLTGDQTMLQMRVFDLLIMCFLKAWSFDADPSLEALEDLDAGSKDALVRAAMPLVGKMMPDFSDPSDPKAVTGGSTPPDQRSSTAAAISAIR